MTEKTFDSAIIGGGLAGLSAGILLAQQGFSVVLFEKENYPFHKVCGEYISLESRDFIKKLGLNIDEMALPVIKKLIVTAPDGTSLHHTLDLGGFGISRHKIDHALKNIAVAKGVLVKQKCKVQDISFNGENFSINTSLGNFTAKTCCGSFGKRSNIDVKWKRPFVLQNNSKLNNFIGVKYHIKTDFPADTIALHNFKNGYCGLSKIEDDQYCLCYLTNAQNLKDSNNSIDEMEKNILSKNIHLKSIFAGSEKISGVPVSISQISFQKKSQVEDHVLMLGDAAGMIAPLCGNGMSMAMHSAKLAAEKITDFLQQKITRSDMENGYSKGWQKHFASRLRTGRIVQRFFGKERMTNIFIKMMKALPSLTNMIIRKTHGKSF